ncbi:unnamed protein product [Bemisia tabaci]|uniref:Uncharacterized protein n=1 Tax=Bemisia tabaci TaxID=7038 RepID=A0A9P0EZX2_BEMTA|nr:unnamed protein product [Bemisia tabaci]
MSRKKIRSVIKEARNRDFIKSSDVRSLGLPGVLERLIEVSEIADFLGLFGMIVNVDKSLITKTFTDIYFLGHHYCGSRVTREEFTCPSLALYSKNPIPTPAYSIVLIASLI